MGRKSPYPRESRKNTTALCPAAVGTRTYAAVAADLGITAESLRTRIRKDESQVPDHRSAGRSRGEEPVRARAENARFPKAEKERQPEREILRRAADYFSWKMN